MRFSSAALALAASVSIADAAATVSAANTGIKGFNYGAFFLNQQAKVQSDFAYEFNRAKSMPGTSGWTTARLYTMSMSLLPVRNMQEDRLTDYL
jgi:glucan endo-1,3-beta-D-glucosidase